MSITHRYEISIDLNKYLMRKKFSLEKSKKDTEKVA